MPCALQLLGIFIAAIPKKNVYFDRYSLISGRVPDLNSKDPGSSVNDVEFSEVAQGYCNLRCENMT